jgi:ribose transport system substrate-binding protein
MKSWLIGLAAMAASAAVPGLANAKDFTIGLSQESLDHPWLATQKRQVLEEAKKSGIKVYTTDGQGSVVKQIAGIEDMLSKGVDLVMIQAGKAEGLRQELATLDEQKIPYMFVGKPILGTTAKTLVSMDNEKIGTQVGQYIVDQLKAKHGSAQGNVVVIEGIPGDETSVLRIRGAMSALGKEPGIKIVAQQPADYRRPQAVAVMQNVLQANRAGTLDAVFAANGEMALGAIQAINDANRKGEMIVTGIDGQKEEFEAIRNGDESATWLYAPCGAEGVEAAFKILKGEEVPKQIIEPSVQITKANVDSVTPAF